MIVVGDAGAERQPAGDKKGEQPGFVEGMAGDQQRGACAHQTADDASEAFADRAADGGKADHRCRCHRPVGLIQVERIGDTERQAHCDGVA